MWIPKTGGMSIYHSLKPLGMKLCYPNADEFKNNKMVTFGHASILDLVCNRTVSLEYISQSFCFAVIRNPFDRAVSVWHWLKKHFDKEIGTFTSWLQEISENGIEPIGAYNIRGNSQSNPQVTWINEFKPKLIVDIKDINQGFTMACEAVGIEAPSLRFDNKSKISNHRRYYTKRAKELVLEIYKDDFEMLGYSKQL